MLRRARQRAAEAGRTLGDIVDDALRVHLGERPASRAGVALPAYGGSGLQPGVDLDDRDAVVTLLDEGGRSAG